LGKRGILQNTYQRLEMSFDIIISPGVLLELGPLSGDDAWEQLALLRLWFHLVGWIPKMRTQKNGDQKYSAS
jgi:hypothetical protein